MFLTLAFIADIFLLILVLSSFILPAKNRSYKLIRVYCMLNLIVEIITLILGLNKLPNLIYFYFLIWIEVIILFSFYRQIISIKYKYTNWILVIICLSLAIVFLIYESFNVLPAYSRFVECFSVFIMSIIYYHDELQRPKSNAIHKDPFFWIVTGFFLYYGGILFLLLFVKYFSSDFSRFINVWNINNGLNLIENVILIYGLICYKRTLKHSS